MELDFNAISCEDAKLIRRERILLVPSGSAARELAWILFLRRVACKRVLLLCSITGFADVFPYWSQFSVGPSLDSAAVSWRTLPNISCFGLLKNRIKRNAQKFNIT